MEGQGTQHGPMAEPDGARGRVVVSLCQLLILGDGEASAPPRFNKYAGWVEWQNAPSPLIVVAMDHGVSGGKPKTIPNKLLMMGYTPLFGTL